MHSFHQKSPKQSCLHSPNFLTLSCCIMMDCNGKGLSVCADSKMPHRRQKTDIMVYSMISTLQEQQFHKHSQTDSSIYFSAAQIFVSCTRYSQCEVTHAFIHLLLAAVTVNCLGAYLKEASNSLVGRNNSHTFPCCEEIRQELRSGKAVGNFRTSPFQTFMFTCSLSQCSFQH